MTATIIVGRTEAQYPMPVVGDRDGICAAQTKGGAGNLTLNGAGISGGSFTTAHHGAWPITLYSTGDLSGVNFTVTGTDKNGAPLTGTVIPGPNNSTVVTYEYFKTVTNVAVSAAVGTNVEVGYDFPLIVVPSFANGRLVTILNVLTSKVDLSSKGIPVLAVDLPAGLWVDGRSFKLAGLFIFVTNGNNKNPVIKLNATTAKDFGAAAAGATTMLDFYGEIARKAASSQRSVFRRQWDGIVYESAASNTSVTDTATVTLNIFPLVLADDDAALETFTLDALRTP